MKNEAFSDEQVARIADFARATAPAIKYDIYWGLRDDLKTSYLECGNTLPTQDGATAACCVAFTEENRDIYDPAYGDFTEAWRYGRTLVTAKPYCERYLVYRGGINTYDRGMDDLTVALLMYVYAARLVPKGHGLPFRSEPYLFGNTEFKEELAAMSAVNRPITVEQIIAAALLGDLHFKIGQNYVEGWGY